MSADLLREAAALMRERAEAATPGPWSAGQTTFGDPDDGPTHVCVRTEAMRWTEHLYAVDGDHQASHDAKYIASWHPAVALAVADWLDHSARHAQSREDTDGDTANSADPRALAVARAYMSGGSDV